MRPESPEETTGPQAPVPAADQPADPAAGPTRPATEPTRPAAEPAADTPTIAYAEPAEPPTMAYAEPTTTAAEAPAEAAAPAEPGATRTSRRVRRERPFWLTALLVIGAVVVLDYWPLLLGKIPLPIDIIFASPVFDVVRNAYDTNGNHAELGDLVAGFYPIHQYVADALQSGNVPLWNPHLMMGMPLLAAYQPGVLYLPNLLLYGVLPMDLAWSIGFPLRMLIAGLGTALFVRHLGGTKLASIAAGLSFAFSGFMLTWSGWPHVDVAVWLPWVFLGVSALRDQPTARRAGLLAIAIAMPLLAGHPQTLAYLVLLAGLWGVHRLAFEGAEGRWRYLGWAVVAAALGGGLAAAQLLPTAEWLGLLLRSTSDRMSSHLPGTDWVAFLSRDSRSTPNSAGLKIPEGAAYLGIVPLFGMAMAVLSRWRADVIFFGATFAVAFLVAFGWGPFYEAFANAPVFQGVPNQRILVLAMFAGAVLCGLGLTAWQEQMREGAPVRWQTFAWWGSIVSVVLIAGYGLRELGQRTGPVQRAGAEPYEIPQFRAAIAALILVAVVAIVVSPVLRRIPGHLLGGLLVAILAVDLVSYAYGHLPFVEDDAAYPEPPVFADLEERDPGVYRVMALDDVYPKNLELQYDEDSPGGTGYQLEAVDPLLRDFGGAFSGYVFRSDKVIANLDDRIDLYNVKYLYATPFNASEKNLRAHPERFREVLRTTNVVVFENVSALPRAFVAPQSKELPAGFAYCALDDASFEPARLALVHPDGEEAVVPPECPDGDSGLAASTGPRPSDDGVDDVEIGYNTATIELSGSSSGVLVLSDVWYPGWKVEVDGEERPLLRVDGAFKGVAVAEGDERVTFEYEAPTFRRGVIISAVSLLVVLLLLAAPAIRRRRASR